jgi:hypothetical protein
MKIWLLDFQVDEYDLVRSVQELGFEFPHSFDGRSKINSWVPFEVERLHENELGNAPGFLPHIPIFDKKAVEAVKDLIAGSAEVLPLICREGEFYAINITQVLNCIDYEKADFETFSDGKRIMMFNKYAFIENIVKGKHIFKIIDAPRSRPFVSDEFRQRVIMNDLKGFDFELAWDSKAQH